MLVDQLLSEPISGRTRVVLAMLADKDIKAVVNSLQAVARQWLLPQISGQRALPPQQLQQLLLENGVAAENICCYAAVKDAVNDALQQAQADDRIVVVGSFVTAAALLADWTHDD
jgi:dihydrofolate synthase/folylpolyglutamate synthase